MSTQWQQKSNIASNRLHIYEHTRDNIEDDETYFRSGDVRKSIFSSNAWPHITKS